MSVANNEVVRRDTMTLLMSGLLSIVFGTVAVFWPHLTVLALLYVFGSYVLVMGVSRFTKALARMADDDWWFLHAPLGLFELGVGVYLFRHHQVSLSAFILLIGFVLIARGVVGLVSAFLTNELSDQAKLLSLLSLVLTVVTGVVILYQPVSSGVAFVWILGIYGLVSGSIDLSLGSVLSKSLKSD